ncbi:MAG: GNAT family N-acetyltransferase [Oscillospiraceae bacterium]|jgi:ribosomal-protein-alanine N-acetyltransferase|nr:GNAT family N-acetyltransferase [Oscillospiraceae bacterium]
MITHKGTQTIQTQRLILRKMTSDDMEMIYCWMSDPEITKYEDWVPHESVDYTRGFISWLTGDYKDDQTYCWGMQLGEEIIGFALMAGVNEWSGSVAYYIKRELWSNGYATEAVNAIIDFMFSEVGVDRITAKHSIKNIASGKVLKKAGMRYRGHVKEFEYYTSKSEWHDCDFYAITKEQYLCRK